MSRTGWLFVSQPTGATFALNIVDGVCKTDVPIARWCHGRASGYLIRYWHQRGATVIPFVDKEQ